MNILGIESSCDDTGLAIINSNGVIIDHITSSQHEIHAKYGGIVPELASRDHVKKFIPLLEILLHKNRINMNDIDIIAILSKHSPAESSNVVPSVFIRKFSSTEDRIVCTPDTRRDTKGGFRFFSVIIGEYICASRWLTAIVGMLLLQPRVFDKDAPANKGPSRPGPFVKAIISMSFIFILFL